MQNQNKFMYVANWKMYLNFDQEFDWLKANLEEIQKIIENNNELIICPSFVSLYSFHNILKDKKIKLGAQNCSNFESGPYTGEISVDTLKQLNCNFCIIGHSERRNYFNETSEAISKKASLLLSRKITPIICIGETDAEYENGKIEGIIDNQLNLIYDFFNKSNLKNNNIIIAYEPVWSIGTGITPSNEYIQEVANFINVTMKKINIPYKLLYGGSVNSITITELKKNSFIDGFLIGKASTDFQELKKIVLL